MSFDIEVTFYFKKQAERLIRKYPSLPQEIDALISSLITEPEQGTRLGKGCYKIRLSIALKGKGKSGRCPINHARSGGEAKGLPVVHL